MPTIKLTSYGTTEFSGNEIIHQKEMKKVEELLKKAVKDALIERQIVENLFRR